MKNKINCNVIGDLLPLYVDEVLSSDSRELVEEHLSSCESCRESAEKMGKTLVISNDTDSRNIRTLKKRISVKRVIALSVSTLLALAVLFGLGYYLCFYGYPISSEDVEVTTGFFDASPEDNNDPYLGTTYLGQGWVINFENKNGKGLKVIRKSEYAADEKGERIRIGQKFQLREIPINLFGESTSFTYGYTKSVFTTDTPEPNPDDFEDEILIVYYKDKKVIYSMREEGLFEPQNPDKYFKDYQKNRSRFSDSE